MKRSSVIVQTLSVLNLCDNKIGYEGIQALSQALLINTVQLIEDSFFFFLKKHFVYFYRH